MVVSWLTLIMTKNIDDSEPVWIRSGIFTTREPEALLINLFVHWLFLSHSLASVRRWSALTDSDSEIMEWLFWDHDIPNISIIIIGYGYHWSAGYIPIIDHCWLWLRSSWSPRWHIPTHGAPAGLTGLRDASAWDSWQYLVALLTPTYSMSWSILIHDSKSSWSSTIHKLESIRLRGPYWRRSHVWVEALAVFGRAVYTLWSYENGWFVWALFPKPWH